MGTVFEGLFADSGSGLLNHFIGQSVIPITEAGDQAAITGRWTPGETLPNWYPDGQVEARRGVLRCKPSDWPAASTSHRARIDGLTYAVESIGARQPTLELQLVEYRQMQIAQDTGRVQR